MKVIYHDLEDPSSALNGTEFFEPGEVPPLFAKLRGRKPFVFELVGENGYMLSVGFGDERGSVQFSPADGTPPYLMAVSEDVTETDEFTEFLAGGTPTPIPQRFCLPLSVVEELVSEFVREGTRSKLASWAEGDGGSSSSPV